MEDVVAIAVRTVVEDGGDGGGRWRGGRMVDVGGKG